LYPLMTGLLCIARLLLILPLNCWAQLLLRVKYDIGVIMFRDVDGCGVYHTWKTWKMLQILKLIVMKFFPVSCYFFPPKSKYSSKHRGPRIIP
jgi:hypothetical protein